MATAVGLDIVTQDDFSGGAHPGMERVPANGVEDLVNGLYADDGSIFKRGGSFYKSATATASPITWVWDGTLAAGQRTLFAANGLKLLSPSDDQTVLNQTYPNIPSATSRPVTVGGVVFIDDYGYAGSLKTAAYSTGNVAVTNGSPTVTGTGTLWAANVDAGMIFTDATTLVSYPIKTVDSNTQVTLAIDYQSPTAVGLGYSINPSYPINTTGKVLASAAGGQRLVVLDGDKIRFSRYGLPWHFDTTDYHRLPAGADVVGAEWIRDRLLVFSTRGVWAITNMEYELTDPAGNVQQTLSLIAPNVMLAGAPGVAPTQGALVVPAQDDIYLMDGHGLLKPVTGGMRKTYRDYIVADRFPGFAAVYNGHYVMPVVDVGGAWVDTLVLRLDTGAWSRFGGFTGQAVAWAVRSRTKVGPWLFAATGTRVTNATSCFHPNAQDHTDGDGSVPTFTCTFRSIARRPTLRTFFKQARVRYELDHQDSQAAATLSAQVATGRPGSSFVSLTGSAPESDGTVPFIWPLGKRAQELRLRLSSSGQTPNLVIRAVEWLYRTGGKR